jgi:hypothetical protein
MMDSSVRGIVRRQDQVKSRFLATLGMTTFLGPRWHDGFDLIDETASGPYR